MSYIVAIFLPFIGVVLEGRWLAMALLLILEVTSLVLLFFPGHLLLIIVAWLIIGQARSQRRHETLLSALRERGIDNETK